MSTIALLVLIFAVGIHGQNVGSAFSSQDLTVIVGESTEIDLLINGPLTQRHTLTLILQHPLVEILPSNTVELEPGAARNVSLSLLGQQPGYMDITAGISPEQGQLNIDHLFMRVTVAMNEALIYFSVVVGWIYFVAWSVSFYPQIYSNYRRKSVVGLNFDFLFLNIVGFLMYGIFNMGLFWNEYIQDEYFLRNPRGLNPVLVNDVVFALHAMLATGVTIVQCFIYERGNQRVSYIASAILGIFAIAIITFVVLGATDSVHWLDVLYYCSYIKLSITLIKYIPQAVMNYRRKSTVGWSIGNIFLDFTGGTLSMLQMIINAYNYDDWASIFGDPTKFGLGLFSVLFDIFFILQHYVFYRERKEVVDEETAAPAEMVVLVHNTNVVNNNNNITPDKIRV